MDFKKILSQAQNMQKELQAKMAEYDAKLFTFDYQGLVSIEIYGSLKIKGITITDNSIIDQSDKDTLEDVISKCVNNAIEAIIKGKTAITSKIAGPGLDGLM